MRKNTDIRNAIDESLSGVRFNQQDMRSVMQAVRSGKAPRRAPVRRRKSSLRFAFTACMLVVAAVPLTLFTLRLHSMQITPIKTITPASQATASPQITLGPAQDLIIPADPPALLPAADSADDGIFDERDALRIARACFEAQCDTDIFTFDEYHASVTPDETTEDDAPASYTVHLESIYGNGCSFRVTVSAPEGEVISYSTPRLATVPMYVSSDSPQVRAWYDQYGPHLFAWPLDAQAEFSRRYEGGALRMPREGEATEQDIASRFGAHIRISELTDDPDVHSLTYHISLYSERASADGIARYQVYCFPGDALSDPLPPIYALITFRASDGAFESKQILSTDGLSM